MAERHKHERTLTGIEIVIGGLLAGLVGGVGMGLVLLLGPDVFEVLGALLGSSTIAAGWIVHLAVSMGFGIAFAVVVSRPAVRQFVGSFDEYAGAAVAFGTALGLLVGGLILPAAVAQAGVATLPLPFLPLPGLAAELLGAAVFAVGHLVYGLLVGATFGTINGAVPRRLADRTPTHN
ncbi:hypothetical protein [Halopiger xanaduensis]|uniref:Uncharacterized protein n=1 Tax=Halopiger xanaduensis (strain DSM 18323 / JCM 14033 / SH-6) TaxID=797210 RepID=F8D890_HALXS|nr:hypothetical protein [Halopiger xanaduensis]AEH36716.1 hypothetical protein Halxa_2091 [Halopiger xanaduensis SH-6]